MTRQYFISQRSKHILHALSRNIKLYLGINIPGRFEVPEDVKLMMMNKMKELNPDGYNKLTEVGPHLRGIEPKWYLEKAHNEVKLIEDDGRIYYGQVNAKGERDGYGATVIKENGKYYEVYYKDGELNGYGRQIKRDGGIQLGEYKNHREDGYCHYLSPYGDT
jgi:hypothetical protein